MKFLIEDEESDTLSLFSQSNLVSDDQPGHLNAQIQDPNLINPWGVAFSPSGPFFVNDNHTGTATVYDVDPNTNATTAEPLVVTIAPPQAVSGVTTASPTGIVFNPDQNGFMLNGKPATFIMDTEDGTISAWNGGTSTTLEVDNSADPAHGDPNLPRGSARSTKAWRSGKRKTELRCCMLRISGTAP